MAQITEQEKKDKRFSIIVSAIIHTSLLVLFIFLVAWRMPDPPPEEYGMELNLGFDEQGSGDLEQDVDNPTEDTENDTPPESETDTEEIQEPEVVEEAPVEETVEETQPDPEPVEEVQEVVEETKPAEPVEEVVTPTETQPTESDVKAEEEKKEEVKEEEKKEEVKPVEEEKKPEPPKPKPKPVVNERALLGSKKSDTDSKETASSNQGKTLDERGNMGKPDGKKSTDGQVPGGADFGVSLSLDGWKWDRPPADKDDSQIDGVIKFRIEVDDRGEVVDVYKIPGTTISDNNVIAFYEKQVRKLIFIRTDTKNAAAAISKGEITFVLKTK